MTILKFPITPIPRIVDRRTTYRNHHRHSRSRFYVGFSRSMQNRIEDGQGRAQKSNMKRVATLQQCKYTVGTILSFFPSFIVSSRTFFPLNSKKSRYSRQKRHYPKRADKPFAYNVPIYLLTNSMVEGGTNLATMTMLIRTRETVRIQTSIVFIFFSFSSIHQESGRAIVQRNCQFLLATKPPRYHNYILD